MKLNNFLLAGIFSTVWACAAHAQLTPFGGQQAGSADGAIPPYTGGLAAMANLPTGSPATGYPDPFASEKPLFSVNASNMAQYVDMLTSGTQALLTRFGNEGFRMDVYPTHRTFSYPAWVLKDTQKNMQTAKEVPDGDGVDGAYGGIPFPVPKDGYQVMWNSFLQYQPAYCTVRFQSYLVDTSGSVTDLGTIQNSWTEPYYFNNAASLGNNFYRYYFVRYYTPAAEAGQLFLLKYPINFKNGDDVTYYYSPGTRRVRLAPEFKYDTPISSYGGAYDYDEIDLFYGRMDKFDFKLIGEKEMIVPYNDYKFGNTTESALLGEHFINSDEIRWERHRVWIVEATLKQGERHNYGRWDFYVDEDSWHILATESFDHGGKIYKVSFSYPWENYSQGEAASFAHSLGVYDMSKGSYEVSSVQTDGSGFYHCTTTPPNMSDLNPQAMAASAIR